MNQQNLNRIFIFFIALVTAGLIYLLSPILTPFVVGMLLAYWVSPIVDKLVRYGLPRGLAVFIVFLLLFSIIILAFLILIPLIEKQITMLFGLIPKIIEWIQSIVMPWLQAHFHLDETVNVASLKSTLETNWMKAGTLLTDVLKTALHSGLTVLQWITNILLIPVVTYYLLRDWNKVSRSIKQLLPRKIEPTVEKLIRDCNSVLSQFLRGQLLVMLSLAVIYSIGLTLIGLQVGLTIGIIAGIASIVPYLGFIIGIVSASIAAYVQFGTFSSILWVFLVFLIGQTLEGTVLSPRLVGHRIGLHPVAVIFAVLTGGMLCGFFGILLALPVAAVTMVMLRHFYQRYRDSLFYQ